MIVENLDSELASHLPEAREVYIAIALAKKETLERTLTKLSENATLKIIVGVDLPTSLEALELLMKKQESSKNIECGIYYNENKNFHPKVYLIKKSGVWVALIGSANLTEGGLSNNVELSYRVTDQMECGHILEWFNKLFEEAYPINDENIEEYTSSNNQGDEDVSSRKRKFAFKKPKKKNSHLEQIDFSDRFFKYEHHYAFRKELWRDSSGDANKERYEVLKRFEELHEIIFPQFNNYGIGELDHNVNYHIVSMYYHLEGSTSKNLSAMWLSYGKKRDEIKQYHDYFPSPNKYGKSEEDDKQSFINHSRLQIRLDYNSIGIWLLFGKNLGGSQFDRDHFFNEMTKESYRVKFHELITSLPDEYWIEVNQKKLPCKSFENPDDLYDHCKKDHPQKYFIIGRDYEITDPEMSEDQLPFTTLQVFKLLYPLHDMMRHRL